MKRIAVQRYPHECVFAYWPDGTWQEFKNVHHKPRGAWALGVNDLLLLNQRPPLVLLHTHPSGIPSPSDLDTVMQLRHGYAWGIMALRGNGEDRVYEVLEPEYWGPGAPVEPLTGRSYLWGIRDCFSLVRDFYALQGIEVPNVPRVTNPGDYPPNHEYAHNYFAHWIPRVGFKEIEPHQKAFGDVAVVQLAHPYPDHCAIYLGEHKYLEHTATRASEIRTHHYDRLSRMNARYYRWKKCNAKTRASWSLEGPLSEGT